jgi:ABC-2 type transport system permease protein
VIFLGVFLVVTFVYFFYYAKFFARNIADVRPLFQSLPFLLIFLVAAVTMRQWSEEQKMGTLEVLLTLPVRTRDLVLGKFAAGMTLVGMALLLTLPLPITASMLGQLDWGPVIGGYVAAALLASAYMAIGLCVSARTDNQIVALMVTSAICSVLYALGSDTMAGFFGNTGAEVLRSLGTGSRFASIERGVLDVRDLFYYGSLTAFFLLLNGYFLERRRLDVLAKPGQEKAGALIMIVGLAAANVVVGNLWLAP